ncbi:diphosphomevalonate decarboxylase [Sandaracinus amylolyticus]|uniref:diphosphomevalonate decarboxylase n=1 Tax=Sandaracinus amylolyticus TaxID=927083 RepID=UPI001F173E1F|nr:diphosphomevalonate decarboxylase [Sandaracinus amylolyticus]UJR84168.1 Hypothetical protein I5071_62390 [Sandaracinus amylolyticus]
MHAVAEARANIALVKYWGKADPELNLPAVPSLSITLAGLTTRTSVRFDPSLRRDWVRLDGREADSRTVERVSRHLDRVVSESGARALFAEVEGHNDFPTAAGLASSASGFAALTLAAAAAAGRELDRSALSVLARRASGSAARSLFGGLVVLDRGAAGDPWSSVARPAGEHADWNDLRLVIGVVSEQAKSTSSTSGMTRSEESPYYPAWVASATRDVNEALDAIAHRRIDALGEITERSALRMHACAMSADPGVVYLRGPTIEGLHAIRELRRSGVAAWFTCDAGPHPKALTNDRDAGAVARALASVPGVQRVLTLSPGAGAELVEARQ